MFEKNQPLKWDNCIFHFKKFPYFQIVRPFLNNIRTMGASIGDVNPMIKR